MFSSTLGTTCLITLFPLRPPSATLVKSFAFDRALVDFGGSILATEKVVR